MAIRRKEVVTKIQKKQMEVTIKKHWTTQYQNRDQDSANTNRKLKTMTVLTTHGKCSTLAFLLNS